MKLIIGIGILSLISVLATASPSFRGIAPQDEALYKSAIIKCKDGSNSFTSAQLNDDFCDCLDGTDEPGTSACVEGRFHCRNAGHAAKVIFSSRVDDGICDCCDGSDESARCPNTCWEQGKAARLKLRAKISTFRDGVSIRNRLVAEAKASLAIDQADLSDLQAQEKTLSALVDRLKDQKEQLDKAEEKERLLKEQQQKANKDAEENVEEKKDEIDDAKKDDSNKDYQPVNIESPVHTQEDDEEKKKKEEVETLETPHSDNEDLTKGKDDADELSREELGRLVASRWTGENTGKQAEDDVKDSEEDDTPKDLHDHVPDSYASETDEDHQHYDDDIADDDDFKEEDPEDSPSSYKYESDDDSHFSDTASPSSPSLLEKLQQKFKNIIKAVSLFQTPVNQSDAAHIRKEYDESSAKLSKIQSRISSLTQKLKHDFGPDKEFYSFYDKCFESKESKYVYKVCPFKHASQEEGHSSTRLGRWEKFDNSYKVMIFSNGDKCWNGPDRSLTVKLRCGLKNEVTDVDEPSRCEYVALLSTPAVCFEDKLKELEHKLEEMNKDQPEKHDEL